MPGLQERYKAEQERARSLAVYPAEKARADLRETLKSLREVHGGMVEQIQHKLDTLRKTKAHIEMSEEDLWPALRVVSSAGKDLAAMEAMLYGPVDSDRPTIVVVDDLGARTAVEDDPEAVRLLPDGGSNGT